MALSSWLPTIVAKSHKPPAYSDPICAHSVYKPSTVMAAPPQIMAADFQARAMTNSFWLRKEILNVG